MFYNFVLSLFVLLALILLIPILTIASMAITLWELIWEQPTTTSKAKL